jgi:hypothetical protein
MLTCLGVPQLDLSIVSCRQEFGAIVAVADILDGFGVSHEGSQNVSFVVHIPELEDGRSVLKLAAGL